MLKLKFIGVSLIVSGIALIIANIFVYPSLLPKITWTQQNSVWIQQTAYLFYIVILTAIASTAIGFIRLVLSNPLYRQINDNNNTFASTIVTFLSSSMRLPSSSYLLAKHEMTINGDEYTIKKKSGDDRIVAATKIIIIIIMMVTTITITATITQQ